MALDVFGTLRSKPSSDRLIAADGSERKWISFVVYCSLSFKTSVQIYGLTNEARGAVSCKERQQTVS